MFGIIFGKHDYYDGATYNKPDTYTCSFEPCEDITTYELAVILKGFGPFIDPKKFKITKSKYESLEKGIKRHFRVKTDYGRYIP